MTTVNDKPQSITHGINRFINSIKTKEIKPLHLERFPEEVILSWKPASDPESKSNTHEKFEKLVKASTRFVSLFTLC